MAKNKWRVVLDTNLWISYLISREYLQLDKLIKSEQVLLLFSEELLFEFLEVCKKPKLKKYFNKEDIEELLNAMHDVGKVVYVTSNVKECRDSKDNFLLALVKDGKADFLLTGDNDLLDMEEYMGVRIIDYQTFVKYHI